ncbi:MAG: M23 family metallopeptidase [Chloroflexota bacterium]
MNRLAHSAHTASELLRRVRPQDLRIAALLLAVAVQTGLPPHPAGVPEVQAAPAIYLPWQGGLRMFTLQGQNQGTHLSFTSKFAFDFTPDPFKSTPFQVRAAREGRVSKVIQEFGESPDCNPAFNNQTNLVVVDHGDGTSALYLHLARNSVLPAVGALVRQGDPLAMTAHTGFVCGPAHLHFTLIDSKTWESRDVPFIDSDTQKDGGRPKSENWYISANDGGRSYRVALPFTPRRARPVPVFLSATPQNAGSARAP